MHWSDEAWDAVQALYDDPARARLAGRLDALLDVLAADPGDARVRRSRMQVPKLWAFTVGDAHETWVILWDSADDGRPHVHYAGPELA